MHIAEAAPNDIDGATGVNCPNRRITPIQSATTFQHARKLENASESAQ